LLSRSDAIAPSYHVASFSRIQTGHGMKIRFSVLTISVRVHA
jgi:hypothetical protein